MAEIEKKITFHYLNGSGYRDSHCDGVFGGVTPGGGYLWIGFFSERNPVPKEAVHEAIPAADVEGGVQAGRLISEESDVKEGVIRTIETGVFMDLGLAENFKNWLEAHIVQMRKRQGK
jgi:hypothetical protein